MLFRRQLKIKTVCYQRVNFGAYHSAASVLASPCTSGRAISCRSTASCRQHWPVLLLSPQGSCAEHVHHAHNILAADGTLAQLLATARAGAHVATVQDHTVHAALHADFAHILFT